MINKKELLCEIVFNDHKTGVLTSRIGIIDESQLSLFSSNSNRFIVFKEKYNSPVLKSEINEIIIHRNEKKISIDKLNSNIIKHLKAKDNAKII